MALTLRHEHGQDGHDDYGDGSAFELATVNGTPGGGMTATITVAV